MLMRPAAEEQRAIICSLESDTADESLYVYTVSQAWYDRWRAYVGLDRPAQPCVEAASNETCQRRTASEDAPTNGTVEDAETAATTAATAETNIKPAPAPGPIEMDLTDEDNISVDEKVMSSLLYTD